MTIRSNSSSSAIAEMTAVRFPTLLANITSSLRCLSNARIGSKHPLGLTCAPQRSHVALEVRSCAQRQRLSAAQPRIGVRRSAIHRAGQDGPAFAPYRCCRQRRSESSSRLLAYRRSLASRMRLASQCSRHSIAPARLDSWHAFTARTPGTPKLGEAASFQPRAAAARQRRRQPRAANRRPSRVAFRKARSSPVGR